MDSPIEGTLTVTLFSESKNYVKTLKCLDAKRKRKKLVKNCRSIHILISNTFLAKTHRSNLQLNKCLQPGHRL